MVKIQRTATSYQIRRDAPWEATWPLWPSRPPTRTPWWPPSWCGSSFASGGKSLAPRIAPVSPSGIGRQGLVEHSETQTRFSCFRKNPLQVTSVTTFISISISNHNLKAVHDGQVEADHQGSELADARPSSLNAVQFPRDWHLIWVVIWNLMKKHMHCQILWFDIHSHFSARARNLKKSG